MTDKEKLTSLLQEFGVGFKDNGKVVTCEKGMDKVDGYYGFFTEFHFDADGKFITMSVWE